ncbi:DUF2946 domain-containing protein [Roseateles sp. BYS180W]|uniref:DUF2946 domain-containing protein n=1 Tax=Roseateles rivi TaxID=3299028 RepID=A0ABW7FX64_9BURK
MRLTRDTKLITSWVAILAVLLMSWAPLVSQLLGSPSTWAEICSASGPKWVQADAASPQPPAKSPAAKLLEHCPYCSQHAGALGLPPAPLVVLTVPGPREVARAFLSAPATPFAWRTAQPRGPPLLV